MIHKKIGLCLGGGSSLGFAHVGVIKALLENDIPIDIIAGTSMGAVVGGAYALSKDIDTIMQKALKFNRSTFTDLRLFPLTSKSIFAGKKADKYLKVMYGVNTLMQDCKIPFGAVAVDVVKGELVEMISGILWENIRASMSVPGVFEPIVRDDKLLIDGGVINNVPVYLTKKLGADIVIAVNVVDYDNIKSKSNKVMGMLLNSYHISQIELTKIQLKDADIIIKPDLTGCSMLDYKPELTKIAIDAGYTKTIEMIPQIKELVERL